jgi:MFS family permease
VRARRRRERLLTPRFALVVAAGLAYFMALGMLIPVVPLYVKHRLGGSSLEVGVASGSLFAGAVVLRPYAGRVGDRFGRRLLIIGGATTVAVSTACYGLVASIPFLVVARIGTGVGEAAFFVGAATMITDLAPVERRGEAVSYWSVAVYGGLAFGPALGETVLGDDRYRLAWMVSASLALLAAGLGLGTVETERAGKPATPTKLLHRSALAPGLVLFLGLIGLAGFFTFLRLYAGELGLGGSEGIFLLYGGLILVVRVAGAALPDRLGTRRAASVALGAGATGLAVMAAWGTVAGLVAGTVVFAIGMSLLYPALLLLALTDVPDSERASVVGTFSSFFDLAQGLGALLLGGVAAVAGYRGAFAAGAVCGLAGLVLLRSGIDPRARNAKRMPAVHGPVAHEVAEPGL